MMSRSSTNLVSLAHWIVIFGVLGVLCDRPLLSHSQLVLVLVCSLASVTQLRPAGVQGRLQVATIGTAVSETDIVAS